MRAPLIPAMKMLHRPRTRRPLAIARVALCVTTLLLQGTLVPLAHASHVGATNHAASAGVHQAEHVAPTHDAATCGLCATLAHDRVASAAPACAVGDRPVVVGLTSPPVAAGHAAAARAPSAPRAPPVLSA